MKTVEQLADEMGTSPEALVIRIRLMTGRELAASDAVEDDLARTLAPRDRPESSAARPTPRPASPRPASPRPAAKPSAPQTPAPQSREPLPAAPAPAIPSEPLPAVTLPTPSPTSATAVAKSPQTSTMPVPSAPPRSTFPSESVPPRAEERAEPTTAPRNLPEREEFASVEDLVSIEHRAKQAAVRAMEALETWTQESAPLILRYGNESGELKQTRNAIEEYRLRANIEAPASVSPAAVPYPLPRDKIRSLSYDKITEKNEMAGCMTFFLSVFLATGNLRKALAELVAIEKTLAGRVESQAQDIRALRSRLSAPVMDAIEEINRLGSDALTYLKRPPIAQPWEYPGCRTSLAGIPWGIRDNALPAFEKQAVLDELGTDVCFPELPGVSVLEQDTPLVLRTGDDCTGVRDAIQRVVFDAFATFPPGRLRAVFIDPVGLGDAASPFMPLQDHDPRLISGKPYHASRDIAKRLDELCEETASIVSGKLRTEYKTLADYNVDAPVKEPVRLVVVFDFPKGFTSESIKSLNSLLTNGPRAGIVPIVHWNSDADPEYRTDLSVVERFADRYQGGYYDFRTMPDADLARATMEAIGQAAKNATNDAQSLADLLRANAIGLDQTAWQPHRTDTGITAPVGAAGTTRSKEFELATKGRESENHALVVGTTGSGKTNLLHVLICSLVAKYDPRELELLLVDFKEGVEFEAYARAKLPHAWVVAIQSEREYGLSVLEGLERRIEERRDLFMPYSARNIAEYREKSGQRLPRTLLVMDEYQELFREDDAIARNAEKSLETLVRQGRSFGIHVLLGSQGLSGSARLGAATMGQFNVRIAMKCDPDTGAAALGTDFPLAALPTRTGEAVYKIVGKVGEESRFQAAYADPETVAAVLAEVRRRADADPELRHRIPKIFAGDGPADWHELAALVPPPGRGSFRLPLGEALSLGDAVHARFERAARRNLLVGSLDEEHLLATAGTLLAGFAKAKPNGQALLVDFASADRDGKEPLRRIAAETGARFVPSAELLPLLETLAGPDDNPEDRLLILVSPQRDALFADDAPAKLLQKIVRQGPGRGLYTVLAIDGPGTAKRLLGSTGIADFGQRLVGRASDDDRATLLDARVRADNAGRHRLFFADLDESKDVRKLRPFAWPTTP